MKKKLACVLDAAMLMGTLSACGSSEGSSDGKKKGTGSLERGNPDQRYVRRTHP